MRPSWSTKFTKGDLWWTVWVNRILNHGTVKVNGQLSGICPVLTAFPFLYYFTIILLHFSTVGRYSREDSKIKEILQKWVQITSPCSRGLASCHEVKQHWNAAPTLEFSETKIFLPCRFLDSENLSTRFVISWWAAAPKRPVVSRPQLGREVTAVDISVLFVFLQEVVKSCCCSCC